MKLAIDQPSPFFSAAYLPMREFTLSVGLPTLDTRTGNPVKRRKHIRYNLRLPALFVCHSGSNRRIEDGRTENISTHGISIVCDPNCCPPVGKRLSITLVLPTAEGHAPGATLKGEGKVVRTEKSAGRWSAFAAETYFKIDLR